MKINIDYKMTEKENPEKISNQEITLNYLNYAVNSKYKNGLSGQMRRIWGRIQRKFDDNIEKDEIELEKAEIDLIKKLFADDVNFPGGSAKYLLDLEEEIEKLGKDL